MCGELFGESVTPRTRHVTSPVPPEQNSKRQRRPEQRQHNVSLAAAPPQRSPITRPQCVPGPTGAQLGFKAPPGTSTAIQQLGLHTLAQQQAQHRAVTELDSPQQPAPPNQAGPTTASFITASFDVVEAVRVGANMFQWVWM